MVLQTANSFKCVDNKNTPPLYKPQSSNKQLAPHIHTATHNAAHRQQAHTNGGAHRSCYAVEQERQCDATELPTTTVHIDVSALPLDGIATHTEKIVVTSCIYRSSNIMPVKIE